MPSQAKDLLKFNSNYRAKLIASCIFNLLIPLMVIAGIIWSSFLPGILLDDWRYTFSYFTTVSNLVIGVGCIIFFVYEILLLRKKINAIPTGIYTVKYTSTVTIFITLITVFFFTIYLKIKPLKEFNKSLYDGPNLFSHLLSPLFALITFLVFEHTVMSLKLTPACLIPIALYVFAYIIVACTHLDPNTGATTNWRLYDWYHFIETLGLIWAWPVLIAFLSFYYLFGWIIWLVNRKIHIGERKAPRILKKARTFKK